MSTQYVYVKVPAAQEVEARYYLQALGVILDHGYDGNDPVFRMVSITDGAEQYLRERDVTVISIDRPTDSRPVLVPAAS